MKNFFLLLAAVVLAGVCSARAQEVTNTTHTIVRFEISTGGLPFGSLDIELFDQEKPETVKNFLRYVYRGAYSNLVIHRLVPNFVLQGGHVTVPNPASTNAFSSYVLGTNFGRITNEYSVGPELSNAYGTIAMARIGGDTNSASDNWFFNLTNNPSLDSVDGGFTVFGRVVNTTGALTGTNLLNYFNTAARAGAFIPETFENYLELPVSGTPLAAPRVADLFTVNAKIIQSAQLPAPQHSVVRFNFLTGGTNFGNLDIELFDQEKPETVKNFLLYVHSGIYSNLILDRLVPNFVLQAGRARNEQTNLQQTFTGYTPSVNWGAITNEYGVGPELANDYGTISMARIPGDTNSANREFFFNLGDNPTLNTNDGGFTVFGRVVNSFDPRSGTNLLNHFNTFTNGNGVTTVFLGETFEFLQELAVSTNRPTTLLQDLFLIQSAVIQGAPRDASAPVAALLEPDSTNAVLVTTNATIRFSGTASDNQAVHRVFIDGLQGRLIADGKTNWSGDVALNPGTNNILVLAIDEFGNQTVLRKTIFYSVRVPVTLQIEGKGSVVGLTNGQLLEIGRNHPLSPRAARGYYFVNWKGSVLDTYARTVDFKFDSTNALVIARFSRNLLGLSPGKYEGVFYTGTNGPRKSSGLVSLSLKRNGYYVGRLKPFGASYGIRGIFNSAGGSVISGPLGTNLLVLEMALYAEGAEAIAARYSDGTFISDMALWRQQTFGKTNPTPRAGTYNFQISAPLATNNGATDGTSFGTATVDAKGRIKWTAALANQAQVDRTGALRDAKLIKGSAALQKGDRWSFYYPSKTGEALAGAARFSTNGILDTEIIWYSPTFPTAAVFANSTNQNAKLIGSRYTAPTNFRPFTWTNGVLTIVGDGLSEPIVAGVVCQPDGSLVIASNPHNIQLTVTNATGGVGGSFTHPASNTLARLRGNVLQTSNSAAGFVPRLPRHGGFELRAAP